MKKTITLIAALLIMASASAQTKFYASLGLGAGMNTARTYDLTSDLSATKVYPVGLGKGFAPALHAGFFVTEFMALDLGIAYRIGFSTKIDLPTSTGGVKSTGESGTVKFAGNMLSITPGILIQPNLELGKVAPYARIGIMIGVMNSIVGKTDVTSTTFGHIIMNEKLYGGIAVGGNAALGMDFNLSDFLAIYAEFCYEALSYAPTKGKITKLTVDGEDKLGDLKTGEKEWKYVKDLSGFVYSDDSPDQQLKNSYPFNNISINFGVKIKLQ